MARILRLTPLLTAMMLVAPATAEPVARYLDPAAPIEERVADLLPRLTLDEKISLLGGRGGVQAIPRLKIPLLKWDGGGPLGLRYGTSTAYPSTLALAASGNTALACEFGVAVGRDCRARGIHLWLAPGVNIYRAPFNGRNFEYFSEDPTQAANIAVAVIRGAQSQGVMATVKHYAVNNQETERNTIDTIVDERTLREIYLPPFRAAVQQAGVWSVMSAYNKLNGEYCTAHDWLVNQVLKREWGFQGPYMSDWGATHETLGAVNGGLDLEMPTGKWINAASVKPLIASGAVKIATIDDKVRRILRMEIACGFLDRSQEDRSIPRNDPRSAEIALRIAREGFVLVKNDRAVLPLDRTKIRTIVVVGPNADTYPAGGGSSLVTPFHQTRILEGLRQLAGAEVAVEYVGLDARSFLEQLLPVASYEGPLTLEYRRRTSLPDPMPGEPPTGRPFPGGEVTRIDQMFGTEAPVPGLPAGDFVAVWTGRIKPAQSGRHAFAVQADAGIRVKIDETDVIYCFDHNSRDIAYAEHSLEAGRTYKLTVEYIRRRENQPMRFAWGPAPALLSADDTARIRAADAAVVCAGFTMIHDAEGVDRTYALPDRQNELIRTVAQLNPRTIVTLNAGGSVATADWIHTVPALLHAFYPGQDGGRAVAEILFGDVNPSGKLPFTWEKRWEDCSAYGNFPGKGRVEYQEGIFVGYRWFDHKKIDPLFPFGHGLSYTQFAYDRLDVVADESSHTVTFRVTNTGQRPGDEVAQVYVAPPANPSVPRPPRELKNFTRVSLAPGEQRTLSVAVPREALAYFDAGSKSWRVDPGTYQIAVGASSRDLRLRTDVEVR